MSDDGRPNYGVCHICEDTILGEGNGCSALGNIYHVNCFTCSVCRQPLRGRQFYSLNDKVLCEEDYLDTLEKCNACREPIVDRILRATGKNFHPQCFRCEVCDKVLDNVPFTLGKDGKFHCIEDFHRKYAPRCNACQEPIVPEPGKQETVRVVALDRSFHVECYKCEDCQLVLSSEAEGQGCYPLDGHILCKACNSQRAAEAS